MFIFMVWDLSDKVNNVHFYGLGPAIYVQWFLVLCLRYFGLLFNIHIILYRNIERAYKLLIG